MQAFVNLLHCPELKTENRLPAEIESMRFYSALVCRMTDIMSLLLAERRRRGVCKKSSLSLIVLSPCAEARGLLSQTRLRPNR